MESLPPYPYLLSECVEVYGEPDESIPIEDDILDEAFDLVRQRCQQADPPSYLDSDVSHRHLSNNNDVSNIHVSNNSDVSHRHVSNNSDVSHRHLSNNSDVSNRHVSNNSDFSRYQHSEFQHSPNEPSDRKPSDYSFRTVSIPTTTSDDEYSGASSNQQMRYMPAKRHEPTQLAYPVMASPTPTEPQLTKVFITYADDQQGVTRTHMEKFCRFLSDNHVEPRIDYMEEMIRTMSVSSWMDTQLEECDFIVVVVTPEYAAMVEDRLEDPDLLGNTSHATYIYRRIHHEFIENHAKNYRFIPLLVGEGKRHHIPRWLQDTREFKWSKDYKDLMYRVLRKSKYPKPKLGPLPVCTVKTYKSNSKYGSKSSI